MRIRKLLALVMVLAIAATLFGGCGEEKAPATTAATDAPTEAPTETAGGTTTATWEPAPEGYITSTDAFLSKMEELLDMSLYETPDMRESSGSIDIKERITYDFDYTVKLNDDTGFTMPCTYADLEKQGWTCRNDPDQEVKASSIAIAYFTNAAGQEVLIHGYNTSDKTIAFRECQFAAMGYTMRSRYSGEWESDAPTFTICETITEKSTLEDIIAALGDPSNVQYFQTRGDDGSYLYTSISATFTQKDGIGTLRFEFSGDTGSIVEMEYSSVR